MTDKKNNDFKPHISSITIRELMKWLRYVPDFKKEETFTITRDDDGTWVISGDEVEKIFKMTKFTSEEAIYRFAKKLRRMGIDDKLKELGAEEGDQVRILKFYFDFKD